jgi:hypothetical protein
MKSKAPINPSHSSCIYELSRELVVRRDENIDKENSKKIGYLT